MINERIAKLRKLMKANDISAYIVPSSDPHQSEYLADYYKTREFITGFTGSAGCAVITMKKSALFTDGRYFLQAENELSKSEVELYKMGLADSISIEDFLLQNVEKNSKIAFDGNTISVYEYFKYKDNLTDFDFVTDKDFIGDIWNEEGRPSKPESKVYIFDEKYSGESTIDRINRLKTMMKDRKIDYHFIGSLDDIAYVLNIRANDIHCNPVVISYLLVSKDSCILYIDKEKLSKQLLQYFKDNDVTVKNYEEIKKDIKKIEPKKTLYLESKKTNVAVYSLINKTVKIVDGLNLTSIMKAHKNKVEIENMKNAFIKDGVALVRYLNWVEVGCKTGNLTEMIGSDKLLEFRKQGDLFIEDSFDAISAYGANASLPHYKPSHEHPVTIKPKGLYLLDSGGHYLDGTTDITRTIALGKLTEDEIYHYTLVLKAHITLMSAKFLEGTNGGYLDAFTRYNMWKNRINFNHGTGHGVGHVLNVHEGPQRISLASNSYPMEEGMVTSDEPGIYISGSHGIRIESIMVCVKDEMTEFGQFLKFENLTVVPIDTRPVDKSLLSNEEIKWLNDYNKNCFEKLSPYLSGNDLEYLKEQCKEI